MTSFWGKIKKSLALFAGKFPSKLPTSGTNEFNAWASSIFELYELPEFPSYRHALATAIMHLSPTASHAPKAFFAKTIRKAMANQIAYEIITLIRDEEKKQQEEQLLKDKQGVESAFAPATAAAVPTSCESK